MSFCRLPDHIVLKILGNVNSVSSLKNIKISNKYFKTISENTNNKEFILSKLKKEIYKTFKKSQDLFQDFLSLNTDLTSITSISINIAGSFIIWNANTPICRDMSYNIDTIWEAFLRHPTGNRNMISISYHLPVTHDNRFAVDVKLEITPDGRIYRDDYDEQMGFWYRHILGLSPTLEDIRPKDWTSYVDSDAFVILHKCVLTLMEFQSILI